MRKGLPGRRIGYGALGLRIAMATAGTAGAGEVPFVQEGGLAFLEVERTGEAPLLALLDTGANASAVDPARARGLPALKTVEVLGTTGTLAAELVELRGLGLCGRALPVLRATRRDPSGLPALEGARVELILGSDALVGLALTLDYEESVLELAPSSLQDEEGGVPLVLDQGIPTIPTTLVPPRLWDELRASQPTLAPTSHLRGMGAGGAEVELPVVPLNGAVVGPGLRRGTPAGEAWAPRSR